MKRPIKVVDVFAGPGGLGEGFSALGRTAVDTGNPVFRLVLSAEMDPVAHQTLRLRAFYRAFEGRDAVPVAYFDFVGGDKSVDLASLYPTEWTHAANEALRLELGKDEDDRILDNRLEQLLAEDEKWVLIGGPPCQAYSLAGRSRNVGVEGYVPEQDHRHFLYRDYLRIIRDHRPAVFVMENVKGLLSSSVGGSRIFNAILDDLMDPDRAFGADESEPDRGYRLYSMKTGECVSRKSGNHSVDPFDFIIRSEDYGIPQRRHRVFILGVREDIECRERPVLTPFTGDTVTVESVIGDLPRLRSGLSRRTKDNPDDSESWKKMVLSQMEFVLDTLSEEARKPDAGSGNLEVQREIRKARDNLKGRNEKLARSATRSTKPRSSLPAHLSGWLTSQHSSSVLNHETRAHMPEDLGRYLFAAAAARANNASPKASDFPGALAPDHRNWKSGKFADRFRVQLATEPATTITSHISKDGHYFIHYEPDQCRSLTVREAARIQTFPDDYFFMGPRTAQYHQVGNAVPPYLALQVSKVVARILSGS